MPRRKVYLTDKDLRRLSMKSTPLFLTAALLVLLALPGLARANVFAWAYDECMRKECTAEKKKLDPCCVDVCAYRACMKHNMTRTDRVGAEVVDQGAADSAKAACWPHLEGIRTCSAKQAELKQKAAEAELKKKGAEKASSPQECFRQCCDRSGGNFFKLAQPPVTDPTYAACTKSGRTPAIGGGTWQERGNCCLEKTGTTAFWSCTRECTNRVMRDSMRRQP